MCRCKEEARLIELNREFGEHYVVRIDAYPDRIYDPSFGQMTEKTDARSVEQKWDDVHVTDYELMGLEIWVPNPPGKQVDFCPWPF